MATISQRCKNGETVSVEVNSHPKIVAKRLRALVKANGGPYESPRSDRGWGMRAAHGLFPELAEPGSQVDYSLLVPALLKEIRRR